ncbi:unnamed protein product (macronuclear) [Paramecium tetraurelia]|uniref:Uncharacterized protein n=1 Tax=Paramecium tetraurelia TaxID=5888 RepID=A0BSE3_PARTE|nr:uncharacterized protein GSPATT00031691001 [Paramecium tetraurelia]CAK61460.1 unnamed protein product [Paramecium tetraurelia]|eukprot:XP_001428858.1 hypothetical protein (macronuclear) [Paramecium tetraurelia strain d4-2]
MKTKNIKKLKTHEVQLKKGVGKPVGIHIIKLESPAIWSSFKEERQLIEYFTQIGRHVYLSLAGTKKNIHKDGLSDKAQAKQEKLQAIFQNKNTYSYMEHVARSLFNWKCKSLAVVYFFRHDRFDKQQYQKILFKNEKWNSIIKNIKFLLNEQFYYELTSLLKMFELHYTTEQIGEKLIEQSQHLDQVPQIVQNFFLLLNKEKRIDQMIQGTSCTQLEILKGVYLNSLENHKDYLYEIIEKIRQIMNANCIPQFSQQYEDVSNEVQRSFLNDDNDLLYQIDQE